MTINRKFMSHEIEADFKNDWPVEATQCCNCTSFEDGEPLGFCTEAQGEVPPTAHCDFFKSID